jgi:hypothetical protein
MENEVSIVTQCRMRWLLHDPAMNNESADAPHVEIYLTVIVRATVLSRARLRHLSPFRCANKLRHKPTDHNEGTSFGFWLEKYQGPTGWLTRTAQLA